MCRVHRFPTGLSACGVLLTLLTGCGDAAPRGVELGVSRTLADVRAATLSEVAYDLRLRIPAVRSESIEGSAQLSFVWDDPEERSLVIDFKDPLERISTVVVNGSDTDWTALADHVLLPTDDLRAGERNEVVIDFRAGDEALNRSNDFMYTLFVPDRAHFSLPVFDQPNLKARVSWDLTVPDDWVAVANGPESGQEESPDGTRRYRFAASQPIPTYLMAFAAGRFQIETAERDGRSYRMFHRETDPDQLARNRDDIFDLVALSMVWMEDYTGISYPFEKYDFALIPSFQYGGMEHPGSVFYRASSLMLDESATQAALLGRASLIAHETAHMWFGDLVTMDWFDDVWTKEVFANFMAAKIVHPSFPEVDHELRFLLAHHPAAYAVDRTAGANAIRQPLDNLREAGTLYGAIIYQKAPIVMRKLERRVGDKSMRAGLQRYLREYSYGNATWPDLIAILDEMTPEDLEAWSKVWVEEPGRPTVHISVRSDESGLRPVITQSDPAGRGRFWPQHLLLVEVRGGGRSTVSASIDVRQPEQEFPLWVKGAPPRWILPNGRGLEYGRFVLDDAALLHLMDDVDSIESGVLRGSAWMVIRDALLEGQVAPPTVLERAVRSLETETDEQMVSMLLGVVSSTYWTLLSVDDRKGWAPRLEEALWNGLERAEQASLKATWFEGWRGIVLTDEGVSKMRALWAGETVVDGLSLSESDLIELAEALAVREVDGAAEIVQHQASLIENPDRRDRFEFVRPALSSDPAEREAFFASLARVERRAREAWVLDALAYLNHPLRQDHALRFIRPALDLIEEVQATGDIFFPGRWLDATLAGHSSPEAAAVVRSFLAERADLPPRLRAKVLQSSDGVIRAADLKSRAARTF